MSLPFNILSSNGIQGNIGNGIAGLVDHIGPAVLADLNGRDDVIQKSLRRDEVHNALNLPSAGIKGCRHHNRQLPCNFADQRFRNIDIPLHGLLYILPVRIIISVEDADAVGVNDIAPLKAMQADPLVNDSALFIQRYKRAGQLRDAACVHGYIFVCGKFLFNTLGCQHRSLTHHLFYRGESAPVAQRNAERAYYNHGDQDGCYQAYCDFLADAFHLFPPQFF